MKLTEKEAPGTANNGSGAERKQELSSDWMQLLRRMMAGKVYADLNLVRGVAVFVVPSREAG